MKISGDKHGSSFAYSRRNLSVLVVSASGPRTNQLRQGLKNIGFGEISCTSTHVQGLERFQGRKFTHVLCDAVATDMPTDDFVEKVIEMDDDCTVVAVSEQPRVDDIFNLLKAGARHYLVVPFAVSNLEEVLKDASEGAPLSEAVLMAEDRNSALVGVILSNLYHQTVLKRQAREFDSAARELERQTIKLHQSMDMAKLFCEGTDDVLVEEIVDGCIKRANTAASRIGRTRKKLSSKRKPTDDPAPQPA